MLIAEYCNNKTLTISRLIDGSKSQVSEQKVQGKREARMIAVQAGAKPWNF